MFPFSKNLPRLPLPDRETLVRHSRTYTPTFHYWMETEVHVYAFSIAANVLLSFFPFLIVMVSFCKHVLKWKAAEAAIYLALADYFPGQIGIFIQRNLQVTVAERGPFQVFSVLLLLFTANGIFEPLEVALNRVWGITQNRSFVKNQILSLGLIFACGGLALLSTMLTAVNRTILGGGDSTVSNLLSVSVYKMAAIPLSMVMLLLIYWLLPNRKISLNRVVPAAIVVGVLLELLKYINLITWPWLRLKLTKEYGPFVYSVTIVLWSFLSAMLVLAGAEWSARPQSRNAAEAVN